jgi:uncharacterized Zn finger protein (UPF0148 family)
MNTCSICGTHPEFQVVEGKTGKVLCFNCLSRTKPQVARMITEYLESKKGVKHGTREYQKES